MKFMRIKLTTDKLKYLISVRLKTCLIKYIHLVLTLGKGDSILLQQGRKKKVLPIHLFFILLKAFIFKFIFFFSNICNLSQFLQINFFLQKLNNPILVSILFCQFLILREGICSTRKPSFLPLCKGSFIEK